MPSVFMVGREPAIEEFKKNRMTATEIAKAKSDIEATADLLERAMKLSGLITTLPGFLVAKQLAALKEEVSHG